MLLDEKVYSNIEGQMAWGGASRVVQATPHHLDRLFNAMVNWHAEGGLQAKLSPKKLRLALKDALDPAGGVMVGIIEAPDGRVAASIAIAPHDHWYSEDFALNEKWFFVRKEFRGLGMDAALFGFATAYLDGIRARMKKDVPLYFGILDAHRLKAKIRLFKRFGRMIGAVFVREG